MATTKTKCKQYKFATKMINATNLSPHAHITLALKARPHQTVVVTTRPQQEAEATQQGHQSTRLLYKDNNGTDLAK